MNRDTLNLAGTTALVGVALVVFVFGPGPMAEGLYRAGLWPRLTPDEVRELSLTKYHINLTSCSKGVNGWDYICEPGGRPDPKYPYDKVGVMGSVFGVGSWSDLPPGPVPNRSAYEAEGQARLERMQSRQR